ASASSATLPIGNVRAVARRPVRRALFASTIHAAVRTRAIAFDDDAKDFLDNQELKRVLAQAAKSLGGKIAVIGMDACLMSLVEAIDTLAAALTAKLGDPKILMALVRARKSAQSYDTKDYVDLVDYCRLVKKLTADRTIGQACDKVEAQGVNGLVLAAGFKGT